MTLSMLSQCFHIDIYNIPYVYVMCADLHYCMIVYLPLSTYSDSHCFIYRPLEQNVHLPWEGV